MAKVSIITPSFNSSKFITTCINSLINQTFSDWEQIIIDDFSSDNTVEIINQYAKSDERIKIIKLESNKGAGYARNKGIEIASGKYIAFLDSDDFWHREKLEKQISFLKSNEYSVVFSQYYIIEGSDITPKYKINSPKKVTYKKMLKNDYIGFLTFMYDVEKVGKIFMPEIRRRQDWAYKLKILKTVQKAYGLQEPLAYYRVGNTSLSSNKFKLLKYNFKVYHEELKYSFLKSIILMIVFLYYYLIFKLTSKEKVNK
tara:strand:+ start:250644 stop:251414 length:771 start_codon:yes stop_codon:yes gene_type:complete